MQLYEFYHITHPETLKKTFSGVFDQTAASTAQNWWFCGSTRFVQKRSQAVLSLKRKYTQK